MVRRPKSPVESRARSPPHVIPPSSLATIFRVCRLAAAVCVAGVVRLGGVVRFSGADGPGGRDENQAHQRRGASPRDATLTRIFRVLACPYLTALLPSRSPPFPGSSSTPRLLPRCFNIPCSCTGISSTCAPWWRTSSSGTSAGGWRTSPDRS